jgi:predicted Zn finger-like uncharacterized protein
VKIPCPACAAKYSVADDKIQSRLAKIRCRKCGVTIVIDGTVDPINVYVGEGGQKSAAASLPGPSNPARAEGSLGFEAAPESGAPDSTGPGPNEYAVDIADNDQRNMSLDRIVAAYNSGLITAETYIWREGMPDWQMLADVSEVYSALHAAARASGLPGGGSFGRQSPDLFGGGLHGSDLGGQDQQMVAGTGARNESSVLFSLSALTSGTVAGPSGGDRKPPARNRAEDSGLIDLQALTAAAESPAPYVNPGPGASFGGPALISAPLGGVTSSTMNGAFSGYSKPSSSKTGFIIGGAILLAAGVGAVAFMMQSGESSTPTGSVAVSEEKSAAAQADDPSRRAGSQPEQGETAAAAEPAEEPVAPPPKKQPTAAAQTAESEDTQAAPVRKVTHTPVPAAPRKTTPASLPVPRATPKPAPEPVAETPKVAPAAPAAPPVDKKKKACDCKPADLMCAMRCSAAK